MKKRKYEKITITYFLSAMLWFLEFVFIIQLFQWKIVKYTKMTIIMINNKEGVIVVEKNKKKVLYSNTNLYWNNQRIHYEIIEEIKLEDNQYVQLRLKLKRNKIKQKEIVEISIKNKNISMMDIIINSWDGDKNN